MALGSSEIVDGPSIARQVAIFSLGNSNHDSRFLIFVSGRMSLLSATKSAIEISDLSVSYSAVVNAKASEKTAF